MWVWKPIHLNRGLALYHSAGTIPNGTNALEPLLDGTAKPFTFFYLYPHLIGASLRNVMNLTACYWAVTVTCVVC